MFDKCIVFANLKSHELTRKQMMKLADKISHWEEAKIISAYQGQAILEYEKRIGHPKFFLSVILLSVFSISIGVIALISANWPNIPRLVKLSADILILLGLAGGIIRAKNSHRRSLTEGLLWAYSLMIMGSIGLISQVYQLQGDIYNAISLWGLLSFALVLMSRQICFGFFWAILSLSSWFYALENHAEWFRDFIDFWSQNYALGGWLLLLILLWGTAQQTKKIHEPFAQALKACAYVYFAFVLIDCDFGWFFNTSTSHVSGLTYWLCGAALVVLIGFYVWNKKHHTDTLMTQFLLTLWGYGAIMEAFSFWGSSRELVGCLLTLIIIGQGIYYCFRRQLFRPANILIMLMALRIFIAFLQVFGNLINTGLGLIGVGILFLLLGYIAKKFMFYNCPRGEHE